MANGKVQWVCSTENKAWQRMEGAEAARAGRSANLRLSGLRHQNWIGWGGCFNELGWQVLQTLPAGKRDGIIADLFDPRQGCRFNFCRMPIGASDYASEWYSLNETAGDYAMKRFSIERDRGCLIPYIKAAKRHRPDLKLFASPWSPPTWMKHPRAYNYGTLVWEKKNLQAYALYLAKFVQAYGREGITIDQVHVQNEPVADQKFPSCLWTGEQLREFIRDYMGPLFRREKLGTEIWLGTINSDDYNGYANTVLSDPKAKALVAGVAYQWAGKHAIQRTLKAWPDVPLMQSENECGDGRNTWDYAKYICGLFQHYIVNGVRAYAYWNMVLAPEGRSTWGWQQNSMVVVNPANGKVTYTPEFYVMKHHSNFIAPGAVRLGLAGPWAANAVCFANPDGRLAMVIANPFGEARAMSFQHGNGTIVAELPARSFSTFAVAMA